jgi:multidrug resistance efflux pump
MEKNKKLLRYGLTGLVVLVAVVAVVLKYRAYIGNPWTRDGQVRAQVIQVAPRVSAPIVNLPIRDNQFVKAGEVLFELDRRTFEAALEQARANLEVTRYGFDAMTPQVAEAEAGVLSARASVVRAEASIAETKATIERNKAEYERQQDLLPKNATSTRSVQRAKASYEVSLEKLKADEAGLKAAKASLTQAEAALAGARASLGLPGEANARLKLAEAQVRQAELNLEFTTVRAPVDGYVTNLSLREGDQAVAHSPALALIDVNSYWVHGFFKENRVAHIEPGDRAVVTLMTYPDTPIEGRVDSVGWGIAQSDGAPGNDLLPNIAPTFEWIRLAQRIPVRVHLTDVPDGIQLRVGTTCSVLVTADETGGVPATPAALQ